MQANMSYVMGCVSAAHYIHSVLLRMASGINFLPEKT